MAEEGAPVSSLGGILGVVMIVVVVLGLLFYGFINAEAFSWENIMRLAPTLYLPVESEELGSVQEPVFSGDIDSERAPHLTATRVGCEIAKKIRDDYAVHGDADRTERENILDGAGEKKLRFVNSGKFRLEWNSAKQTYWDFWDLSSDGQRKILSDCSEKGGQAFQKCLPKLDEACITAIFKNLKVPSGQNFCGSFVVGKNSVSFGNKNCGEAVIKNSEGVAWADCAGLCPDGDKLTWKAASAESVPELSPFSFSEEQIVVKDDMAANKFPPECSEKGCEPEHIYTIFWNKERKIYEVHVRKFPMENSAVHNVGVANAAETIAKIFRTEARDGAEGAKLPEARLKADFVFSPLAFPAAKQEYFLSDFANDILEKINENHKHKIRIVYEDCSGSNCLSSYPKGNVKFKETIHEKAIGVDRIREKKFIDTIYIKTPFKDSKMDGSKAYRILIYKWISKEVSSKSGKCKEGASGAWCDGQEIFECVDASKCGGDMWITGGQFDKVDHYAFVDYTIVITEYEKPEDSAVAEQPGPPQTEKPDLSPRISVSGAADPNKIKINIQIINSGLGQSKAGAFNFQIANANGEEVRAETLSMPAIAAGDVHTETWPVDYSHAAGTYKLTFNVDVHEDNDESDETNNRAQDVYTMPLR